LFNSTLSSAGLRYLVAGLAWMLFTGDAFAAEDVPKNWYTGGRDGDGTYFSPLAQINAANAKDLGFAWQYDLGSPQRGQEATPIVIDGVMYTSGTWGYVYALDAATGMERWRYDPKLDYFAGRNPCCDLVNRGVAVWQGRVYVGAGDGRLHAIDAASGRQVWTADTIVDHALPYASTGAPQIAGDVVVIGNAGADMGHGGVRGYVSAYSLATGRLKWRFYTVPPAAGEPVRGAAMIAAAKTWDPSRGAEFKGGGTAWDGMAYDPKLNLVYVGTANSAPYDLRQLGPANLDGLYTASIVALDAATGRLVWYYQTTPHDSWDFDAVQKMVLTDLTVDGAVHPVLLQANKNGFFYVLDRRNGKLLSADNFTYVNWASKIDMSSGRPVLLENSDWHAAPKSVYPSWAGGHTWNPMAFNPRTHLVYIPVIDAPAVWVDLQHNGGDLKYLDGFFTANGIIADNTYDPDALKALYGPLPAVSQVNPSRNVAPVRELLRAWDPIARKTIWEQETSSVTRGYDGGVMSTAGNLVLQGRGSGGLWIYAADTGKVLKVLETGSHIMAAPMTYAVGGEQFVAVQVGYGGVGITVGPIPASSAAMKFQNPSRILAFKLQGGAVPMPAPRAPEAFEKPPRQTADARAIHAGELKFVQECSRCHVLDLSITPDLRRLNGGLHAAFKDIVLHGSLAAAGMERFDDILSETDVDDIHAYLIDQSWQAYDAQQAAATDRTPATGKQ
jgi:quinohemoprotein ethanol dehydrogenase